MTFLSEHARAFLTAKPFAHRGLHDGTGLCPENSLIAAARAVEAGFPIELDVRLSRDGEVVVFHDATLLRMTGADGAVADKTWADLSALRLLGGSHGIPRLADVLSLVAGRVPLLVEVKQDGRPGALEKQTASLLQGYRGDVAVQSFNPLTVGFFARHAPGLPRGQLADLNGGGVVGRLLSRYFLNGFSCPQFVAVRVSALPHDKTAALRTRGLPVLGWTVRSEEARKACAPYTDNIIFEGFVPT